MAVRMEMEAGKEELRKQTGQVLASVGAGEKLTGAQEFQSLGDQEPCGFFHRRPRNATDRFHHEDMA